MDELVVTVGLRNHGIGRKLTELAEGYYRDHGAVGMWLGVRENNEPAIRLYVSLGYVPAEHRIRMLKDF